MRESPFDGAITSGPLGQVCSEAIASESPSICVVRAIPVFFLPSSACVAMTKKPPRQQHTLKDYGRRVRSGAKAHFRVRTQHSELKAPTCLKNKPFCKLRKLASRSRLSGLWRVDVRFRGRETEGVLRVEVAQKFAAEVGVGVPGFSFRGRWVSFENDCRETLMFHFLPKIAG